MASIKGTAFLDTIKSAKERLGEKGYQNIINLVNDETRQVFQSAILASEWYSLDALSDFLEMDLKEYFNNDTNNLILYSGRVAEKQLSGIYKVFIKLGTPEFILKRIVSVNKTYFKDIETKINDVAPGKAVIRYKGLKKTHRLMEYIIIGFFKKALELSGAKNVKVEFTVPIMEEKEFSEATITWLAK